MSLQSAHYEPRRPPLACEIAACVTAPPEAGTPALAATLTPGACKVDAGGGEHLWVDLAPGRWIREARDPVSADASREREQVLQFGVLLRGLLGEAWGPGHYLLA